MSRVKKIVGSKMFTFVRVILSIVYRSTGTNIFWVLNAGLFVVLLKYMYINNSYFSPAAMCVESRPTGATGSSVSQAFSRRPGRVHVRSSNSDIVCVCVLALL